MTQQQFSDRLQVSRNYVSLIETDAKTPSSRLLRQIDLVLTDVDNVSIVHQQRQSSYLTEGKPPKSEILAKNSRSDPLRGSPAMQINPRFQPADAQPTAEDCLAYFKEYVARAARAAGGVGYAFRLLQKHFPLDEFEAVEPEQKS